MRLFFNASTEIKTMDDLYSLYKETEFESPKRSTVYLLSFVKSESFKSFLKSLQVNIEFLNIYFEYNFNSPKGKGEASFTDLMLIDNNKSISVEAKYTEPEYETVNEWLKKGNIENRKLVLSGWLETINKKTDQNISEDDVENVTYQMIHRLASSCSISSKNPEMVYLYFGDNDNMENYYKGQLNFLKKITSDKIKINFVKIVPRKTDILFDLENKWEIDKKSSKFKKEIIHGIKANSLLNYEENRIEIL